VLTPNDIKNSARKSGYNHVGTAASGTAWQANVYGGKKSSAGHAWWGPIRKDPAEAAQDYCDYINSNGLPTPATLASYPTPKVDMGVVGPSRMSTPPPVTIIRNEWDGPTDVYDVVLYDEATDVVFRRKVGITARGSKRYADIAITFGFSIRPMRKAVTYNTKARARKAETAKIAEVDADPNWRRVAKECWAPVGGTS
jgi:hypothetical protein